MYFKSIIVLDEVICLFLGPRALFRDSVVLLEGFSFRGFWKGNCYRGLMPGPWDPVTNFS